MIKRNLSMSLACAAALLLGSGLALAQEQQGALSGPQMTAADEDLANAVRTRIQRDDLDQAHDLTVTARDGVVMLSGKAESPYAESRVLQDAQGVSGVKGVENHMKLPM